ncbi:MAG TPA: DEAD/DEAH box helicase [Candidatus Acidoferrum sp.]|nr:DEAD/DEAH box helicase [Candidatus Acidoferrum sp.]
MNSFEELGLSPEIQSALKALGFEVPFPIQEAIIPLLWSGSDVIGQAHTGTGKTAAFGLPILEIVDEKNLNVQALVLVPTRELAMQVADDINSYAKLTRKRALAIYGGQSIHAQIDALEDCPQIIVGTPGRILDHLERGSLHLENVQCVVLDEADRMLDMGFIDDVERILRQTGRRQIAFFSATMPDEVRKLARKYMKNPREVLIESDDLNVKEIKQYFCQAERETKLDALLRILHDKNVQRAIVFCRTKRSTFWLTESLRRNHENATAINGDLSQNQRDRAMENFRSGYTRVLVATDLAGRGLDIDGVTHIINYDVPEDPLTYFHRIGRTGRAGKTGTAVTIVSTDQSADFRAIETMADYQIQRLEVGRLNRSTLAPRTRRPYRLHNEARFRFSGTPYPRTRHGREPPFRGIREESGGPIADL